MNLIFRIEILPFLNYRFLLSVLDLSWSWSFKLRRGVTALVTAKCADVPLGGERPRLLFALIYNV